VSSSAYPGAAADGPTPGAVESRWAELDGPVHYLDYGGPADAPLLLLVHGLGGSAVNWAAIAPELAMDHRVLAIDLAGFGRTQPQGRSTHIRDNERLLARFVERVCGQPVILVGNSMGGLISILLAADRPDLVAGLVLVDPAVPVGVKARPSPIVTAMFGLYALPAVGRLFVSGRRNVMSAEQQAYAVLKLCTVDPQRVPRPVLDQHVDLARERAGYPDVDTELVVAARSLLLVIGRRRWLYARMAAIPAPVLLLHGDEDRLVPIAAARAVAAANPTWRFEVAHDIGHVPQLEDPEWTVAHIRSWLGHEGAVAALATRP
jgi:pimeloyl-ACP methyl ester carboxylesterase